jgi:sortase (surface protein transpeptidase)
MSDTRRPSGRRGVLVLAAAVFVVLAGVAALLLVRSGPRDALTAPPAAPTSTTQSAPGSGSAPSVAAALPRSTPTEIDVPSIGATSTLIPLGLNPDNSLQVPPVSRPMQAGWYAAGPTPGEIGPAVIVGHVDGNKQKGIFYRLRDVVVGDEVLVTRHDGVVAVFVVTRTQQIPKDQFPTQAVYGDTTTPDLRLITCGGSFDRSARSYRDNIIVYATLRGTR